jgi:hypothetical protein
LLLGEKIMSDGITKMYDNQMEEVYRAGVAKVAAKKPEEIYLLLKDLLSDIQYLAYDERLVLTRNQFASVNRIHSVVKELLA